VADLVHHGRREIPLGRRALGLRRIHHAPGQRQDDLVHARVHEILEENLFRAFFLMDTRIVRQIVGDRLVAVAQVARAERRVHHFHRRRVAADRRPVVALERQRVLNVGNPSLVRRQLPAFRLVSNEHGGAV
jgi:hypothetical protein